MCGRRRYQPRIELLRCLLKGGFVYSTEFTPLEDCGRYTNCQTGVRNRRCAGTGGHGKELGTYVVLRDVHRGGPKAGECDAIGRERGCRKITMRKVTYRSDALDAPLYDHVQALPNNSLKCRPHAVVH